MLLHPEPTSSLHAWWVQNTFSHDARSPQATSHAHDRPQATPRHEL